MAAAGLPPDRRRGVILWGIFAATVLRIALSLVAADLLAIIGLTLAGGILLLWVAWKLYREFKATARSEGTASIAALPKTFRQALIRVVIADLSMSLDNVLAIAGTARDHIWVPVAGLTLSVALMGAASHLVATRLERHRWIAWVGLAVIAFVSLRMIYDGSNEVILQFGRR